MASIVRTPQGRWKARYRTPTGESRSKTFTTKQEATRFLSLVGADMIRGDWVDPQHGRIRLDEWARTFLRTTPEIDPNTRATYARDLERYVLPRFGAMPMSAIKRPTCGPGSPTSSRTASRPARCTGTSGPCGACSTWPSRARSCRSRRAPRCGRRRCRRPR